MEDPSVNTPVSGPPANSSSTSRRVSEERAVLDFVLPDLDFWGLGDLLFFAFRHFRHVEGKSSQSWEDGSHRKTEQVLG